MLANIQDAFSWYPSVTFLNILGLNRIFVFVSGSATHRLFGENRVWVRQASFRQSPRLQIWIAFAWTLGMCWFVYLSSPFTGMIWYWDTWGAWYDYAFDNTIASTIGELNSYTQLTGCSLLFLALIVVVKRKASFTTIMGT